MSRLAIISHTPHYRDGDRIIGLAATVREISYLARLFDSVRHVAPLHDGPAPGNCVPYDSPRVTLRPVAPAGGETVQSKLSILGCFPGYARAIAQEAAGADVIHVRCPANISLLALAELRVVAPGAARIWVKYAGAWQGYPGEPLSYRLQRRWLANSPGRALVTINGSWPGQPAHVRSFYNPCLTEAELAAGAQSAKPDTNLERPILLFVGRLDADKGFPLFLDVVAELRRRGHAVEAEVVGDGPRRADFEQQALRSGLEGAIRFYGWRTREELNEYYGRANFIVLPSRAEGWPKVLSEAMAFGVVPLASKVGSIEQYLAEFQCGRSFAEADAAGYCNAIADYLANPALWRAESGNARLAARRFSYDAYLRDVAQLLGLGKTTEDSRHAA